MNTVIVDAIFYRWLSFDFLDNRPVWSYLIRYDNLLFSNSRYIAITLKTFIYLLRFYGHQTCESVYNNPIINSINNRSSLILFIMVCWRYDTSKHVQQLCKLCTLLQCISDCCSCDPLSFESLKNQRKLTEYEQNRVLWAKAGSIIS